MDSHDQTHMRPSRSESNIRIWRASKTRLYLWSIQESIITAAGEQTKTGMQHIRERRSVPIQPIQTDQHLGDGQRKSGRVPGGSFQSAFQFAPVVAIARCGIGANPLMRRGL